LDNKLNKHPLPVAHYLVNLHSSRLAVVFSEDNKHKPSSSSQRREASLDSLSLPSQPEVASLGNLRPQLSQPQEVYLEASNQVNSQSVEGYSGTIQLSRSQREEGCSEEPRRHLLLEPGAEPGSLARQDKLLSSNRTLSLVDSSKLNRSLLADFSEDRPPPSQLLVDYSVRLSLLRQLEDSLEVLPKLSPLVNPVSSAVPLLVLLHLQLEEASSETPLNLPQEGVSSERNLPPLLLEVCLVRLPNLPNHLEVYSEPNLPNLPEVCSEHQPPLPLKEACSARQPSRRLSKQVPCSEDLLSKWLLNSP